MDFVKGGQILYTQAHFRLYLGGSGAKTVKPHFSQHLM